MNCFMKVKIKLYKTVRDNPRRFYFALMPSNMDVC